MAQQKEKLLHHVKISVFCKAYESKDEVLAGLEVFSPIPIADILAQKKEYDNERPKTVFYRTKDTELTIEETESDDGKMTIYTLFFKKMHDTNSFVKKVLSSISESQRAALCKDPDQIIDDDGHIKLRFDKRSLMAGKTVLVTHGDCYLVDGAVAAYPKTYEAVYSQVSRMLN